jgi:hypothetical protein
MMQCEITVASLAAPLYAIYEGKTVSELARDALVAYAGH